MVLYIVRQTEKFSEKYFVGKYFKNVVISRPALHPLNYRGSSEESKVNMYIYFFLFNIFIIIIIIILLLSSPLASKQDIVVKILVRCICVRPCIRASIRICPDHNLCNNAWI